MARKTPQLCGGFHVSKFSLLSFFCLFCLSFSSLPLLFDILQPKRYPPDGVSGYMGDIYIHTHIYPPLHCWPWGISGGTGGGYFEATHGRNFIPPPPSIHPLSGPLNRLNAIISLLHPLDRYRTPSAIGSAIGRPLSRAISHPNTGGSPQPPRSKPLGGLNHAIVAL